MTRSKGFYWAGRALAQAGKQAEAQRYFEAAAQYANQFYGLLRSNGWAAPSPRCRSRPRAATDAQRREFPRAPSRRPCAKWRAMPIGRPPSASSAKSQSGQKRGRFRAGGRFARQLGRRDLAVIAGQAAENAGYDNFRDLAFR
jgi:soluble lytic murein transglycosylase